MVENNKSALEDRLFNSLAVSSLNLETEVYDAFKKLGWTTHHSPYFIDSETNKFREIDITARKYWKRQKDNLSCDINFIVECKSIKDYHILVSNRLEYENGSDLNHLWIGDDSYYHYQRTIQLLKKHNIRDENIKKILKQFHLACFPKDLFKFYGSTVEAFSIPVFNSFRETNIGNTKELETSVVWKAFQSLYSCIENYKEHTWSDIDYFLYDIENEKLNTEEDKANELLKSLIWRAEHLTCIHPVLIMESELWEVTKAGLSKLKYFRLIFQKMFTDNIWIDIVNKNFLQEYLDKTKKYDKFFLKKKFI